MFRCPGQDQRYWKPGDIFEVKCSECGRAVEFFKDEPKLRCRGCGQMVENPKIDLGCAKWCQYAEQCLGSPVGQTLSIIQDRLIDEMKNVFGEDQKRTNHAPAVLEYAEQIQATEGGDPLVVKASAILHDIGILQAEKKYGSSAGKYQELEGPGIAKDILEKHDISKELIEHICQIIANHHSAKDIDTIEFRIVWDADWLVNIPEEYGENNNEQKQKIIEKVFKTRKGKEMAMELYGVKS